MGLLDRLFNRYKFVRRAAVGWGIWLATWVTLRVFEDLTQITPSVAAAYATAFAVAGMVLKHYNDSRREDDRGPGS